MMLNWNLKMGIGNRVGGSPPFKADLYPLANPTCSINNNGGRWLKFDGSTNAIDKVGSETRPIHPDRCVTSDVNGGGVKLPFTSINVWAVAFRFDNYIRSSRDFIIGKSNTQGSIGLACSNKRLGIRDTSFTYVQFDGSGNSSVVKFTDNETYDVFMFSDGVNIYAYVDGNYKGYITPSDTTINFNLLINVVPSDNGVVGNHYDYRIWDLTTKTAQEINDYFSVNGCLFHVDNMNENATFPYHRWLMNEGAGTVAFDSGTATPKLHGTYFYDDVNVAVDNLHNTTLFPVHILNWSNKDGFNIVSGTYIPADHANTGNDVQGNELVYKGRVKLNAEVQGDGSIDFKGSANNAIGFLPHLFFNRLCYTGNPYNYPPIWDGDTDFINDTDLANPYQWADISESYVLTHINTAYKKYFYEYLKSGTLKEMLFYTPQRTTAQNTILNSKNYIPNY